MPPARTEAAADGMAAKDLLRFITCGSVDDGKSTLIGRLLHDSKLILEDQLVTLANDSERHGVVDIDFALLVDGLEAEREQGITIDVAYRFFTTPKRSFIVADTPGHEQYTRNMASGASNAELAIILVDARKGVLVQTRRHSLICSLLGIRHVVVAVNKMDLVGYAEDTFERIVGDYSTFAAQLGFTSIVPIPVSARFGDNITRSGNMPWYHGPLLLDYLERADVEGESADKPFRFPVQWVNRPNLDFRGYAGTVVSGTIAAGDPVVVASSGQSSRVKELLTYEGVQASARSGDAITMTLTDEVDIARGDVLVGPVSRPEVSDQFAAHVIWMSEQPLLPGRSYLARIGTRMTSISITGIKHKIDVNTREHLATHTLGLNDIGVCNLATGVPVAFDPYAQNRGTGSFIIIDRFTNHTVGAGMIDFGLRRGTNLHWQTLLVGKAERAVLKRHRAAIMRWGTTP
jgi:bifunctional enzyme CysN/CysC